jgi:hypothetical protein
MVNPTGTYMVMALSAATITIYVVWFMGRARVLLRRWSSRNGYKILRSQFRTILKGPFTWRSSRNQAVFRVTILDREGMKRIGWVRCGSVGAGVISDEAEVKWDDPR